MPRSWSISRSAAIGVIIALAYCLFSADHGIGILSFADSKEQQGVWIALITIAGGIAGALVAAVRNLIFRY